jgi:predicted metal-dependent hydrolase
MPLGSLKIITHRTIKIQEKEIPYKLIISAKARRLSLKIGQQSGLEVVAPRNAQLSNIPRFIHEKEGWVLKHLREIERKKKEASKHAFKEGSVINILGIPKKVHFLKIITKKHTVKEARILQYSSNTAFYKDQQILIYLSRRSIRGLTEKQIEKAAKEALIKHLKERAKRHITKRTASIAERMGLTYKNITIKNHKSRGGSCSRDKNLNFNWRLILTTPEIVDSIIIHELCHLVYMNHGKRFYNLLESHCPEHKQLTRQLAQTIFPL